MLKYLFYCLVAAVFFSCSGNDSGHRTEKTYFPNGELQKETKYSPDGTDWEITKYFENGTVSSHATYHNGKYVGEAIIYFPNGQKNFVQNYDSLGRPDGRYSLYSEDGVLRESGNYVHGKRDGAWHTYDKDGHVSSEEYYEDGEKVERSFENKR